MSKLIYLEIPDSLRIVDDYAVQSVKLKLLTRTQEKNDTTYYLGTNNSNLYSVGYYSFADCIDSSCTTIYITPSIVKTSTYGSSIANFNNASNLTEIYVGNSSRGS